MTVALALAFSFGVLQPISPAERAGQVAVVPTDAVLTCAIDSPLCVAANLSRLYSQGGKIASSPCLASDSACAKRQTEQLAAAAAAYRDYRARARVRRSDPTLEARFGDAAATVSPADLSQFVDSRLLMAKKSCPLSSAACVQARVYIYADVDQAVRLHPSCIATFTPDHEKCIRDRQVSMARVDRATTRYANQVLERFGWLNGADWGIRTEDDFFLLVQHADADVALQRSALGSLRARAIAGRASKQHLAYLEDRVRVHEGRPQLYGTQGRCGSVGNLSRWTPDAIENPAGLEERRRSMGMSSFTTYRNEADEDCTRIS